LLLLALRVRKAITPLDGAAQQFAQIGSLTEAMKVSF
jgi:hypothetical protein